MTTATYNLPHQSTEKIAEARRWSGFVGIDNLEAIRNRIAAFAKPGRSLTMITWDDGGLNRSEVRAGLTLAVRSDAFREPIEYLIGPDNAYISVSLAPGINSFGVRADRYFSKPGEDGPDRCMTAEEVRDLAWSDTEVDWQGWYWIKFDDEGSLTDRPMIEIRSRNEHGYRKVTRILTCDAQWQQRAERDAIAADQIAAALKVADPGEWDPAAGIDPAEAAIAARVVEQVAANLRRSREPLTQAEVYPVVDNL